LPALLATLVLLIILVHDFTPGWRKHLRMQSNATCVQVVPLCLMTCLATRPMRFGGMLAIHRS
jgi:hypothetical protein